MAWYEAFGMMLAIVLILMAVGVPVVIAFIIADIVGAIVFMGGLVALPQLVNNGFDTITTFTLIPIPLFLIMGELFFHTGMGVRVLTALDKIMGNLPARQSYLAIGGGTIFAALSGSSLANTALLGSMMVPDMRRRGYSKTLAMGPILATGGLAMLIPPSALAVLLGSLARVDIGALLIAGIVPGLALAALYAVTIFIIYRIDPEGAPKQTVPGVPVLTKLRLLVTDILPMGLVIFAVVGLILLGWATPSESAAFGVLAVLILALAYRCLTLEALWKSLAGALRVSCLILLIILASATFSQILAFSGASAGLIKFATSFDAAPLVLLLAMFGILLVLGMFMEQLSMMLLTVPVFFPLATQLGFDPIWFAVIILMALEISFTTPPFGMLLFVMKGVAPPGTTMYDIYKAAVPFILCSIILVALLILEPGIALGLGRLLM